MTLDAVSWTVAPNTLSKYFSQQLRWRRSNLVDMMGGLTHAYKLHPVVGIHYMSMFAMILSYPLVIWKAMESGHFFDLGILNLAVLVAFGAWYRWNVRHRPDAEKVNPLWFMSMAIVMPTTYLLATPLAFFTLDSGSWETRAKQPPAPEPKAEPQDSLPPVGEPALAGGGGGMSMLVTEPLSFRAEELGMGLPEALAPASMRSFSGHASVG